MVKAIAAKAEAEAKRPALAPEVAMRLERMEQSIDAIAVEIERIIDAVLESPPASNSRAAR